MDEELARLASFSSLLGNANVSPLTLARYGFCYDGMNRTAWCECGFAFDPVEHSSASFHERHRDQSPGCRFVLSGPAPIIPPQLTRLSSPVGGHTDSDYGSQIGPDARMTDGLQKMFISALDRAKSRGVFRAFAGGGREPTVLPPEAPADPQLSNQGYVSNQRNVVYRGKPMDSSLHTFSNWPANESESDVPSASSTHLQPGSAQGHTLSGSDGSPESIVHLQKSTQGHDLSGNQGHTLSGSDASSGSFAYKQESSQGLDRSRNTVVLNALMDRMEVLILMPTIQRLGFSNNDLRTVVAERLTRGEDCLNPRELLEAFFEYYRV